MAKILVLNGSPRKGGNTETLVDAFIEGAGKNGNSVKKFNLQWMDINGCLGCLKCMQKKGSPCAQKDDMGQIYGPFSEADIVVFASPMYFWSFTSQMKAVLDRLFAAMAAKDIIRPDKGCAMIIAAEEDSKENFAPLLSIYNTLLSYLNWENRGTVLAGGLFSMGDAKDSPYIEEARKLGQSL